MDWLKVDCVSHELKHGFAVVHSSKKTEIVIVKFTPKIDLLCLTMFELHNIEEGTIKENKPLQESLNKDSTNFEFYIPVQNSMATYNASFIIQNGKDEIKFELPIVVFYVDPDLDALKPSELYKPLKALHIHINENSTLVRFPKSDRNGLSKNYQTVSVKPATYVIDKRLNNIKKDTLLKKCPVLNEDLCFRNYVEKFKLLIGLDLKEEFDDIIKRINNDYKIYFIEECLIGDLFEFKIDTEGLHLESSIYVQEKSISYKDLPLCFEGVIRTINSDSVLVEISKGFREFIEQNKEFIIHVQATSYIASMMNRALSLLEKENMENILFPKLKEYNHILPTHRLNFFNKNMLNNSKQKEAVSKIVYGKNHGVPFIIFGPPGTGKTTTILEAIKQVYTYHRHSKILVCAPFNKHVNEITLKLMDFIPQQQQQSLIHRFYASGYPVEDIPAQIKPISNLLKYSGPLIQSYRIVLATVTTAGRFTDSSLKGNFTHIFIDESAFATEPETLIPLVGQVNSGTRIILAGDPKQLKAVSKSELAKEYNYTTSLIERLMNSNFAYSCGMVVKLIKNYRCHPAIIKIPNELFYENELQPCADIEEVSEFCSWRHLPTKNFPIIFHHVEDQEIREKSNPSYFNLKEIEIVYKYVDKLLKSNVKQSDIGIITTYKCQAQKITRYLQKKSITNVFIGSVVLYMSIEKKVIILSTVRSNLSGELSSVGFVNDPRSFNVSLTRAKSLEIVVGNEIVLRQMPFWDRFISYCKENNSFINETELAKSKKDKIRPPPSL
ncbi:putative helicase mov-10-B.1 [Argonauta hians]